MAGERLVFATPDFSNPTLNKEKSVSNEGLFEGPLVVGEIVDFNPDSFAWLRLCRTKDGQTSWANAICYDFARKIQFYYDFNFITEGLAHFFGEDPYRPYQAVISFSSCEETADGKIASAINYGAFYYDKGGKLRTIRGGQITHPTFQPNVTVVNFRQREDDLWSVYPVADIREPMLTYFAQGNKPVESSDTTQANGQEKVYFEMVYSLAEISGRMRVVQHSLTGHIQKTMEVPLRIDIPRWSYLLGQENCGWVKAFTEFPSSIVISR